MSGPPRNPELERMLIDVLRASDSVADRAEAWAVYADWLLGVGEPVGEWLAASLRADDETEAAAPIRAQLGEIEAATRFRLVDNDLADLSEVPELSRIAELTWERGFITSAAVRCRTFRPWDSELLGHTPDRLLDVVLRSASSRLLHTLELDTCVFAAVGSRHADLWSLLAALPGPLPLRSLVLGCPDVELHVRAEPLARVPELTELELSAGALSVSEPLELPKLTRLRLRVGSPAPSSLGRPFAPPGFGPARVETFATVFESERLPGLRRLELNCVDVGQSLVERLVASSALARLDRLHIENANEALIAALLRERGRFGHLRDFVISGPGLSPNAIAAVRELGWTLQT
jgi:hypothetical protein